MISAEILADFIRQRQATDDIGVIRFVRTWIREWQEDQG